MAKTVIGVYDAVSAAQQVSDELLAAGFPRERIRLVRSDSSLLTAAEQTTANDDRLTTFFRTLFGADDRRRYADHYAAIVSNGGGAVLVDAVSDDEVAKARDIVDRAQPVDIDARYAATPPTAARHVDEAVAAARHIEKNPAESRLVDPHYAAEPTAAVTPPATEVARRGDAAAAIAAPEGETRIPVVEEQITIGKREVERGGVRVVSQVVEKPVEENVNLREQHATVERRPVDRPATEADLAAFREGTLEVRETVEEPVVEKVARVVEEVVVGRTTTERTATIRETVRRTEVNVENLGRPNPLEHPSQPEPGERI